jgi:hypothetical protein
MTTTQMKPAFHTKWLLLILPFFYLVLSFVFLSSIKQFYISHLDPAYEYLLNGTNLAGGHFRIGIDEHPGTPVKIFAALVIFIKHLFFGTGVLYQDVLMHPESYLYTCSVILALLLFFATYFAGTSVFHRSGNIGLGLLFQSAPLVFTDSMRNPISLSAESSITIVGILFTAFLYTKLISYNEPPGKTTTNKNVVVFGLFTALLFTTKIYCAPVILLVLFMIKRQNQRILYLVSSGLFSLVLLFPLYTQMRNWVGSIKDMVLHSGPYGQGNSGIINVSLYKNTFIQIFTNHYIFTAVYIFAIAAFLAALREILKKRANPSGFIFPIIGILIFFTLFILIIAKQYTINCLNPLTHTVFILVNSYYLILPICFFPLAIAISYKILSPLVSFDFFRMQKQKLLYTILAIFIVWNGGKTFGACYEVRNQNVSLEKTCSFLNEWKNTPLIIIADGGEQAHVEPALLFGSYFSGKWEMLEYFDFLKKIYPDTYLYSVGWKDVITFWGSETDISTILKKNNKALIYISGADSLAEQTTLTRVCLVKAWQNKIVFKKIYSSDNKYENIYLASKDSTSTCK